MSNFSDQKSLEIAIELGFLSDSQMSVIQEKAGDSQLSRIEVAIRQGFLNRQHLEILASFGSPEEVAPGYRIDGLIGQGGAGVVYMATQIGLNRSVALKTINQNNFKKNELAPKRFEREAQIVGQLRHPNIVSAFDFGTHNDRLYLVMEFVDGIDGEKYLHRRIAMPEGHAWQIALQVCHALSYANELGIIHRDIKPGNLIFTAPPKGASVPSQVPFVKIADFGLARFKEQTVENNITMDSAVSGTPFYMSPEQISAQELDHRSDIYGLGTTVWHLIAGHPPITGDNPLDIIYNRIKNEDEWLAKTPDKISEAGMDILRTMCRFDADERVDDYAKLIKKIEAVLENFELPDAVSLDAGTGNGQDDFIASTDITYIEDLTKSGSTPKSKNSKKNTADQYPDNKSAKGVSQGMFGKHKGLAIAAGIASLLAAFLLIFFNLPADTDGGNGSSLNQQLPKTTMELGGPPIFLFDGLSVQPNQRFSGTWEVAEGDEGGKVLAGNGTRNFKCVDAENKPLEHFRFDCGFRHKDAEMIQFRWLDSDQVTFYISISREEAVLYDGESVVGSCKLDMFEDEVFGYHQIQIESLPGHWSVSLEPNMLGVISKAEIPEDAAIGKPTIQVAVEGSGIAQFETIRFRRFVEPNP